MKLPAVMCMEGGYTIEAVGIDLVNLLEGFKTRSDIFGVEINAITALGDVAIVIEKGERFQGRRSCLCYVSRQLFLC
jgi:hypothetical protein